MKGGRGLVFDWRCGGRQQVYILVAKRTETGLLTSFHSRTGTFSIQAYLPPPPSPSISLSPSSSPHPTPTSTKQHQFITLCARAHTHTPTPTHTHTQYLYTFSSTPATTKQSLTLLNHMVRSFDRQLSEENLASLKSAYFFALELVSLAWKLQFSVNSAWNQKKEELFIVRLARQKQAMKTNGNFPYDLCQCQC